MDFGTSRPLLDCAERAARAFLAQKVTDGVLTQDAADVLVGVGFHVVVNALAGLRREGMSERAITDWLVTETVSAEESGQALRLLGAQLYEAVWRGIQEDLTRYVQSPPRSC